MKILTAIIIYATLLFNCSGCDDASPVQPQNNSPEILSLDVFPNVIGPSDSVIVICEAIDPDGDTLVYDWITDGRVRIKGSNWHYLYHTSENTRVFYPKDNVNVPIDTLWIQCFARDGKGKSANGIVLFIVKRD
ncbi:MAG: hypothetical protein L6Q94_23530 [Calditrichia bacterium]|nr:hypothetical protein [Calditrichia bacterium]